MSEKLGKQKDPKGISRRGFFTGALAAGTLIATNLPSKFEEEPAETIQDPEEADLSVEPLVSDVESNAETVFEKSESIYFEAETKKYAEIYRAELPYVLPLASLPTKNDERGRSRMKYIGEELTINGVSPKMEALLRKLFQALPVVESGYDAGAQSEVGARSLMQIMSVVWDEHKEEGMNPQSLIDQVKVASKYLAQTNRHLQNECKNQFERIKTNFFNGDQELFDEQFLLPTIISSYFAGMGTMDNVIIWFDENFKKPGDTFEALSQSEIFTQKDIYYMLAHTAFVGGDDPNFGEKGFVYPFKVYGARKMLDDTLDATQKELLL